MPMPMPTLPPNAVSISSTGVPREVRGVLGAHPGDDAEGDGPVVPPAVLHLLTVPSLPRRHSGQVDPILPF